MENSHPNGGDVPEQDLQSGETCWRRARAERIGWCIDGEEYFAALRSACEQARREILIVGWDIDSRLELIRDRDHPHYPSPLADMLESLARANSELRVHVLAWDFAVIYLLERELLPARAFGWRSYRRLHFALDDQHALGASHHQKLVVIDGRLAFIGGMDLTRCRWDTRAHSADDPRRLDPDGNRYPPFHDVQAVVTGEAAADLRALADLRWKAATGSALPALERDDQSEAPWPADVSPRADDVSVAIARTWNSADGSDGIREIQNSYLQQIAVAQQFIYIENQYFSCPKISDAIARRLAEENGPDVVIVLPLRTEGWLEQATMDLLRARAIATLRDADHRDRLRVVSPVWEPQRDEHLVVHSKIMIVDGRVARIGSANISQRSMGLDTESDLIFDNEPAATALCAELLAEHLGAAASDVEECLRSRGLLAALDAFSGSTRQLRSLELSSSEMEEALLLPIAQIADMEQPIARAAADAAAGTASRIPRSGWLFLAGAAAVVAFWLYAVFAGSEVGLSPAALLSSLRGLATHPLAPFAVLPAFVAGSLLVAPVTGMVALCALLFDPWIASIAATAGILLATVVTHWLGAHYHSTLMHRVPDAITDRVSTLAESADAWSLAGLRLLPIAPFTLINLVVGAAGVGLREFLLGTLIALAPTTVVICMSVDRARAALAGEAVFDPWIVAALASAGAATILMRGR